MKSLLRHGPGRIGFVLLVGLLVSPSVAALGQAGHSKPPVAPRDGKPTHFGPPPPKISAATLTFRLRHDRRLDGSNIHVSSSGHRVGLYGSVPNDHQRRVARQIAQSMIGITYVADHMTVLSTPSPPANIVRQVQTELNQDSVTRGAPIAITAHQDVVTLQGTVATLRIKLAAIHHAQATPRVSVVQDHLAVPPGPTDDALASAVSAALQRDTANPVRALTVAAKGGYIYLRGTALSKADKQRAGDTASAVPGVTGMTNALTVLPSFLRPSRTPHS